MSDLSMSEFVDIAWGEFCLSDDHIVPDPGKRTLNDHFILEDRHKKRHRELASNSSSTGDRPARYADQGGDQVGISPLRKRRDIRLEKDSWSPKPDSSFTSAFDSNPENEASNLASDSSMPSSHALKSNKRNSNSSEFYGLDSILDDKTSIADNSSFDYPMGDLTHTGNDVNYFENAENNDSSNLLYCDWPEIENFEDIDRMFRSCDSTFGLGVCREDEMGWLSSEDTGGSGNVLKSDVKFPYSEPSEVENMSENHDFSNGYSTNNSSKISAAFSYKDSSWTSDTSNSYRRFVIGPDCTESKDGFIPQEQGTGLHDEILPRISTNSHFTGSAAATNEHKSQIKQENQTEGKGKEHNHRNYMEGSSVLTSRQTLQSVHLQQQQHPSAPDSYSPLQNPVSYMHSNDSHLSDPSSLNPRPFVVKSETNEVTSFSPRDSSHASSQLQYMEGSPDPGFEVPAPAMREQRKKLHCSRGNAEGISSASPAELGSSNIPESLTTGSDLDDISLEAASFRQLQLVMEQLDLRTKLCLRDSLYRLARSAEQRHNLADLNAGCGRGDTGTKSFTSFMDMETDTNPIDRSVAHLLFHRPSESPTIPAQDPIPFKSSSVVYGSVASRPVLVENLFSEENVSEVQKVSDC